VNISLDNKGAIIVDNSKSFANVLLILICATTVIFLVIQLIYNDCSFSVFVKNCIFSGIIFLIFYFILFRYILYIIKKKIIFKNGILYVNKKVLNVSDGEIRFVYENLDGYHSRLIYCKCYFEQGYGVKQKKVNICAFTHENTSVSLFNKLKEYGLLLSLEHRMRDSIAEYF
jgi:hypothetical protein